jgi:hypothetical protein
MITVFVHVSVLPYLDRPVAKVDELDQRALVQLLLLLQIPWAAVDQQPISANCVEHKSGNQPERAEALLSAAAEQFEAKQLIFFF